MTIRTAAPRTCSFTGCTNRTSSKGLCVGHYAQQRRGATLAPLRHQTPKGMSLEDRMADAKSRMATNETGCWLWTKATIKSGNTHYGVIGVDGKALRVHRVALVVWSGEELNDEDVVHHRCATSTCFRPAHLQVVKPIHNHAEMHERNTYIRRIAELEALVKKLEGEK